MKRVYCQRWQFVVYRGALSIGLYRENAIAIQNESSTWTLTVVMCNTSQCKLRSTFRNLRVTNVICIVTYYTLSPLESPDSFWMTRTQRSRLKSHQHYNMMARSLTANHNVCWSTEDKGYRTTHMEHFHCFNSSCVGIQCRPFPPEGGLNCRLNHASFIRKKYLRTSRRNQKNLSNYKENRSTIRQKWRSYNNILKTEWWCATLVAKNKKSYFKCMCRSQNSAYPLLRTK